MMIYSQIKVRVRQQPIQARLSTNNERGICILITIEHGIK